MSRSKYNRPLSPGFIPAATDHVELAWRLLVDDDFESVLEEVKQEKTFPDYDYFKETGDLKGLEKIYSEKEWKERLTLITEAGYYCYPNLREGCLFTKEEWEFFFTNWIF